jgi:hypothetical protein
VLSSLPDHCLVLLNNTNLGAVDVIPKLLEDFDLGCRCARLGGESRSYTYRLEHTRACIEPGIYLYFSSKPQGIRFILYTQS